MDRINLNIIRIITTTLTWDCVREWCVTQMGTLTLALLSPSSLRTPWRSTSEDCALVLYVCSSSYPRYNPRQHQHPVSSCLWAVQGPLMPSPHQQNRPEHTCFWRGSHNWKDLSRILISESTPFMQQLAIENSKEFCAFRGNKTEYWKDFIVFICLHFAISEHDHANNLQRNMIIEESNIWSQRSSSTVSFSVRQILEITEIIDQCK